MSKEIEKKAYLKGAAVQLSLSGKTAEQAKPVIEKLARVFEKRANKVQGMRELIREGEGIASAKA